MCTKFNVTMTHTEGCDLHLRNWSVLSTWSRGMIPALGAGGPGFNPRSGPFSHSVSWNRAWERYGFYYLPAWDLIVLLMS